MCVCSVALVPVQNIDLRPEGKESIFCVPRTVRAVRFLNSQWRILADEWETVADWLAVTS